MCANPWSRCSVRHRLALSDRLPPLQPTGQTNLMRWPFLDLTVDYQGFYRSSDRWPAFIATIAAGLILGIDRGVVQRARQERDTEPT